MTVTVKAADREKVLEMSDNNYLQESAMKIALDTKIALQLPLFDKIKISKLYERLISDG